MRKNFTFLSILSAGFVLTSCVYDGNYWAAGPTGSLAASYSTGYGWGYGYGTPGFNSSVFVSTGNPRWGYDPFCRSYFDYRTNCFYDPFLHGYYPLGFRPPALVGVPHPVGWRTGFCPPPRVIRDVRVVNYQNRASAYRASRYDWAKQVRNRPTNPRIRDSYSSNRNSRQTQIQRREETRSNWNRTPNRNFNDRNRTNQGGRSQINRNNRSSGATPSGRATQNRGTQAPRNYYSRPISYQGSRNTNRNQSAGNNRASQRQSASRSSGGSRKNQSSRKEEKRNKR